MKIEDLINKLKDLPQDMEIVVRGYEDGFDFVTNTQKIKLVKNENNNEWEGVLKEGDGDFYLLLNSTRKQ